MVKDRLKRGGQGVVMSRGDWLPKREQDLADLAVIWKEDLSDTAKQTAFGWNAAGKIDAFLTARAAYLEDKAATRRLTKDEAKEAAKAAMRDFANTSIRFNKHMEDAAKARLGVHPGDPTHTPHPDPQTVPVIAELKPLGACRIEIRFHDEATPGSRAIPAGYNGCLLRYTYGPERITEAALLTRSQLMTRSPFTLNLPADAERMYLSCCVCWQNGKGHLGQPGEAQSVVIA
jgi:hypothetical protein